MPFPQMPLAREEGLELIRARGDELLAAIDQLAAEEEATQGPMGWTAADHLMHIVAWHRRLLGWMADEAAGREVVRPEPGYTFEQIDELNERDFLTNRGTPLADARRQFDETYEAVIALVEGLSDEELNEPGRYAWLEDDVVLWYPLGGNSWDHYEEHLEILASGGDGEAAGAG
jgi:hypothetical protein